MDLVRHAAGAGPQHGPGEPYDGDVEAGLLAQLAAHRLLVGLAGLDPAAGQRPQPFTGRAAPPHEQKPPVRIGDDRPDASDALSKTKMSHNTKITTR
ncbi:hypothetical protein Mame01_66480 [Microbispora amethystogenes]|nr:hypothetical protein Mame01_66480 [Microbispora amethystogenes]